MTSQAHQQEDLTELDRQLVLATQTGLPLDAQPYHRLAASLGVTPGLVMERINAMLADGRIRRIAAVPNHYRLGYVANGMSVWDIPDEDIHAAGHGSRRTGFRQPLLPSAAGTAGLALQPVCHGARPQP